MKLQELANTATDRINANCEIIQLVMPQRKREYKHYYMAGKKSPKGERISFCRDGEIVNFNAIDVLAYCVAHGAEMNALVKETGETIDLSKLPMKRDGEGK